LRIALKLAEQAHWTLVVWTQRFGVTHSPRRAAIGGDGNLLSCQVRGGGAIDEEGGHFPTSEYPLGIPQALPLNDQSEVEVCDDHAFTGSRWFAINSSGGEFNRLEIKTAGMTT
jgi:hypothetical protein